MVYGNVRTQHPVRVRYAIRAFSKSIITLVAHLKD